MRRDPFRTSDPTAPAQRDTLSRLGVDNQRDLRNRDRDNNVRTPDHFPVVVCTTVAFYRDNIGSAGAATYATRIPVPTADVTWGSNTQLGYRTARAGVVVRGYLWSNAARAGGTCFLRVRITNGAGTNTDYDFTDCVLDGAAHPELGYTRDSVVSQALSLADGFPYAAGDRIQAIFVADAGWLPTTADLGAHLVLAETEWIRG